MFYLSDKALVFKVDGVLNFMNLSRSFICFAANLTELGTDSDSVLRVRD